MIQNKQNLYVYGEICTFKTTTRNPSNKRLEGCIKFSDFVLTKPYPLNPISCPVEPQILTTIAIRQWPSTTCVWNVQCYKQKSWEVLHNWITENCLWYDSRGFQIEVFKRCCVLLYDMNGQIINMAHLIRSQLMQCCICITPHNLTVGYVVYS